MRSDRERLTDIPIEKIERYTARGRQVFYSDELVQMWMIHHLQIVGEASAKLGTALRENHPEIPWLQITAMRNFLVHDYFAVDMDEVWVAAEKDIPTLRVQVEAILEEMDSGTA